MLRTLSIRNLVTIERVDLELSPGMTAITGDTGAGKSMLLEALDLVLGGRADFDLIRAGADRTTVDIVVDLDEALRMKIGELVDVENDSEIVLSRDLNESGRSNARVDNRPVPAATLRQIGGAIVDVHGQSEHLSLLQSAAHLTLLDRFGGLDSERIEYEQIFDRLTLIETRLNDLEQRDADQTNRSGLLRHEIDEIESAGFTADQEEQLQAEHRRLGNLEELTAAGQQAYDSLRQDSTGSLDRLADAEGTIRRAAPLDDAAGAIAGRLLDLKEKLEDVAAELRVFLTELESDPARFAEIEERLASLATLKRKYGSSVSAILKYAQRAREELDGIESRDEQIETLRTELTEVREQASSAAWALHLARLEIVRNLEARVAAELSDLGFSQTTFSVDVGMRADPMGLAAPSSEAGSTVAFGPHGVDSVEFQLAANPGEPLRPLKQAASGGEMSRVMLGLKSVLGRVDGISVLIFDEIDSGVGGRGGHIVGRKLAELARHHQVICITHLPQVACYADHHVVVRKRLEEGRTFTDCVVIEGDDVVRELSDMLGQKSEAAVRSAEELLAGAMEWKNQSLTLTGAAS